MFPLMFHFPENHSTDGNSPVFSFTDFEKQRALNVFTGSSGHFLPGRVNDIYLNEEKTVNPSTGTRVPVLCLNITLPLSPRPILRCMSLARLWFSTKPETSVLLSISDEPIDPS